MHSSATIHMLNEILVVKESITISDKYMRNETKKSKKKKENQQPQFI